MNQSSPAVHGTAPEYVDVVDAAERLRDVAHRTPVTTSRTADHMAGTRVFFKCENYQRVGAFKFRGAYNAISKLGQRSRGTGVLTYSSGNHAQAVALAGGLLGVKTTIVMPEDAPKGKVTATKGYGGEIVFYDRYKEDREALARALAAERAATLIPPFDHPDVIAGQGTAAKELMEAVGRLDFLFVCLGGGGLLAGSALAAAALSPGCAVIGVEPEAGNDGQRSLRSGALTVLDAVPATIADGAQTTRLGDYTFPVIQRLVSDIVTVSDEQLVETMRFFAERMKMVVEPTGCLAAAAVLHGVVDVSGGRRVGVIVSGGNVDLARFASLLG